MVTVSVGTFKANYPEFRDTSDDLCRRKLDSAARRVSETVFGDSAKDAVMLKAADLLSKSPEGEQARLKLENRGTMYGLEFDRLVREKTMGVGRVA